MQLAFQLGEHVNVVRMGRTKSLDAALVVLRADRDDVRGVLHHLLAAWRERPGASELADLIDRAPCPEVPEVAGARKAPRAAWLARAERRDPLDIPALLATWLDAGAPVARARLAVLLDGPHDCRIEHALAAHLANVPRTSEGTLPMWRQVFDAAATFRDPRAWQLLRDARPQGGIKMQDFMRRRLAKLVPPVAPCSTTPPTTTRASSTPTRCCSAATIRTPS
jgi:hypothetical protein